MIIAALVGFLVGYASSVAATMTTDRISAKPETIVCVQKDNSLDCKKVN